MSAPAVASPASVTAFTAMPIGYNIVGFIFLSYRLVGFFLLNLQYKTSGPDLF